MDQLTGFGQVSALAMLQHIFTSYGAIDKMDLKENAMDSDDPVELLARLVEQFEKGR